MASSEHQKIWEEIGRWKMRVEILEGEVNGLKEKNDTLDEANLAMHGELAKANRKLEKKESEKVRLQDDIRRLNEEMEKQYEEIENLQEQLAKAQRTIKVQSDQIAAPNEKKSRWTPSSHGTPSSKPQVDFSRPPPTFNLPQQRQLRPAFPSQHMPQPGYLPAQPPQSMTYPYHTPLPLSSMSQSTFPIPTRPSMSASYQHRQQQNLQQQYQHASLPVSAASTAPPATGGGPNPSGGPSGRAVQLAGRSGGDSEVKKFLTVPTSHASFPGREEGVVALLSAVSSLFLSSEAWAREYCSVPSKAGDAAIPLALKTRIASATAGIAASTLLSHGWSRVLVVARLLNSDFATVCLRPSVLGGLITDFRPSIAKKLEELRSQNAGVVAINVRRGLLVAGTEIVIEATKDPHFDAWIDRQARYHADQSWTLLAPLRQAVPNEHEARTSLKALWVESYRAGVKMACMPSVFTAEFPTPGPESVFNPANMANKDNEARIAGTELARRGAWVRMAVTPVVTMRDYSATDGGSNVIPRVVHFSNCLLTIPEAT